MREYIAKAIIYAPIRVPIPSIRGCGSGSPSAASLACYVKGIPSERELRDDFETNELNDWYIRDHYVAHHDRLSFIYLHGPHHDAIPIGLMAV